MQQKEAGVEISMCSFALKFGKTIAKPRPISYAQFLPIMLLSNAQKFACYAQYYPRDY